MTGNRYEAGDRVGVRVEFFSHGTVEPGLLLGRVLSADEYGCVEVQYDNGERHVVKAHHVQLFEPTK